jgi:hypothetical protein
MGGWAEVDNVFDEYFISTHSTLHGIILYPSICRAPNNYVELAPTHPTNYLIPPHNLERTVSISLARNATLEMSIY